MRLNRLRQMGFAEIAERSRQEAAKWVDRVARRPEDSRRKRTSEPADVAATFDLFREAAPRRFFPGCETSDTSDVLRERVPAAGRDVIDAADEICARRFSLLGYEGLSFGESVDWHLDPVSGRRAPALHWSRIDPLNAATVGDSKVTWELNRHQWLITLAQAYQLTGDPRYAERAVDLVSQWCRANPYGIGINWSSSLEVAYRLIAWIWAFVLLRNARALSPEKFAGLRSLMHLHATHIERYLSRYSSPNTHLTGEALGLFYGGVLFPEFPEAGRWRSLGAQILTDECNRQVHGDGVHFEQATCYQRYTVEIYLHFLILAKRNGLAVPPGVRGRVERMLEFLLAVNAPDGSMPQIGDADGGWLLPLGRRAPGDCRGVFAIAAAVFGRADFAWAAGEPAPELLWMLGVPGWNAFMRLPDRAPTVPSSSVFEDGGYVVMRSGWTRDAHQLLLDVGPLGCSVTGAHGHADLLSLQCVAFGEKYLVDPGTYCYSSEMLWRDYFRGTTAHSTVVVDGAHQAEPRGPFGWRSRPSARLHTWKCTEEFDYVDAAHDGYTRLPDPVIHRRRVLFVKPRYWVVVDDLMGRAEHDIEVRFQFGDRPVRFGPGLWAATPGKQAEGLWIAPFTSAPLTGRIAEGQMKPIEGWLSTDYGQRRPAPALVYSARTRLPVRIATLLLPVERLSGTPERMEPLFDRAGTLVGLRFIDTGETVRIDEDAIVLETVGRSPDVLVGATPGPRMERS